MPLWFSEFLTYSYLDKQFGPKIISFYLIFLSQNLSLKLMYRKENNMPNCQREGEELNPLF